MPRLVEEKGQNEFVVSYEYKMHYLNDIMHRDSPRLAPLGTKTAEVRFCINISETVTVALRLQSFQRSSSQV